MMADTELNFKALKKIEKTKMALKYSISRTRENQLYNKLYKQFKELAEEMVNSVQYIINHRGFYEDAGYVELNIFDKELCKCRRLNREHKTQLLNYINNLISNLKH